MSFVKHVHAGAMKTGPAVSGSRNASEGENSLDATFFSEGASVSREQRNILRTVPVRNVFNVKRTVGVDN